MDPRAMWAALVGGLFTISSCVQYAPDPRLQHPYGPPGANVSPYANAPNTPNGPPGATAPTNPAPTAYAGQNPQPDPYGNPHPTHTAIPSPTHTAIPSPTHTPILSPTHTAIRPRQMVMLARMLSPTRITMTPPHPAPTTLRRIRQSRCRSRCRLNPAPTWFG
jgi:hypothetical protein